MIVVVFILSAVLSITTGSLAFAIVLWMLQDNATFEDVKDNFKIYVIYNVIMLVVGVGILALLAVSPALALLPAIGGIVLSFKLLMNWFDLSFFGVIGVSIVAGFIQSYFLNLIQVFLTGLLM